MPLFNKGKDEKPDLDFDIDAALDMESFDFEEPSMQNDRKPVVRLASGLYKGASDGVRDSTFLQNLVKDMLPRGYGQTMEAALTVNQGVKDIYEDASRELRPVAGQLKSFLTRNIPEDSKLIPKKIQEILSEWREEQDNKASDQVNHQDMRQLETDRTMAEVFGQMEAENAKRFEQDQQEGRIEAVVGKNRHRDLLSGLGDVSAGLLGVNRFNNRILIAVHKKQIELQLRQLFAIQDSLEFLRSDATRRDQHLVNITKNTALPEFVKIGKAENFHQVVRNKFLDTVNNGLFGDRGQFIENMVGKAREKVVGEAKGMAGRLAMGLAGANMAKDVTRNTDRYETAGQVVGQGLGQSGLSFLGNEYKDKLQNSKMAQRFGLQEKGDQLDSFVTSIPNQIEEFRRSDKWDYDNSFKGSWMRSLQSLVPSSAASMEATQTTVRQLDAPYNFTRRTDRSINEIIPGWLARIHQSMEGMRTGGEVEMMEYDQRKQSFSLKSAARKSAKQSIFNPANVRATQNQMEDFTQHLDPQGKLSPEAAKALQKRLLQTSARSRAADVKNLGNVRAFEGGDAGANKEAAEFMEQYLANMTPRQKAELTKRQRDALSSIGETRGAIQQEINLGGTDWLQGEGLLDKSGRFMSMDKILENYLDPENAKNASEFKADGKTAKVMTATEKMAQHAGSIIRSKVMGGTKTLKSQIANSWADSPMPEVAQNLRDKAAPLWDPLKTQASMKLKEAKATAQGLTDTLRERGYHYSAAPPVAGFTVPPAPEAPKAPQAPNPYGAAVGATTFNASPQQPTSGFGARMQQQATPAPSFQANNYGKGKESLDQYAHVWTGKPDPQDQMAQDIKTLHMAAKNETDQSIKGAGKSLKDAIKGMKSVVQDVDSDLYVEGEEHPRLTAAKMKEGKYVDKETGKTVRRAEDIKGDVVDDGNNTVLEAKEVSTLVKFSQRLGMFIPAFRGRGILSAIGRGLWHYQTKIAPAWVAFNWRVLKGAIKGTVKAGRAIGQFLKGTNVRDVYVQGESEPRMTASKMKAGYYTHKSDGSAVKNQNDIKGEVLDEDGNTAIAEHELDKLQVYHSVFRIFNPLKLVGWAGKKIFQGAKWLATTGAMMATKAMWKGLKAVTGFAGKALYKGMSVVLNPSWEPTDVYVKGQDKPSLVGKLMVQGKYFSRLTKKMITRPHDIDGDVVDESGKIILTEQEIKDGLLNPRGQKLSTKLTSKVSQGLGMLKRAISMKVGLETPGLRRQRNQATGKAREDGKKEGLLDKVMGKGGSQGADKEGFTKPTLFNKLTPAEQQVSLLKDLLGIFKRQEKAQTKKKILGDNGEGLRTGSWQERKKKKEVKKANEDANKNKKDDSKGGLGALMKSMGKMFGMGKKDDDEGGGLLSTLGGLRGLFGAKAAAGAAGLGGVAAGASALGGAGAAAGAAGVGAAGAGAGVAAGAAGAAAAGGAAAGGVALAPILLGAAAVGVLGYAAYKGAQWLSTINLTDMEKVRYAQYGFSMKQQKYSNSMIGLESDLSKIAKKGALGIDLDDAKIPMEKLMDRFGLSVGDKTHVSRFKHWYNDRFRPVFLHHLNALHAMKNTFDLSAVNKMSKPEQVKYLDETKMPNGPYRLRMLPLDESDYESSGPQEVNTIFKSVYGEIAAKADGKSDAERAEDAKKKHQELRKQKPQFIPVDKKAREDAEIKAMSKAREKAAAEAAKISAQKLGGNPDSEDPAQGAGGGGGMLKTAMQGASGGASQSRAAMAAGPVEDGREGDQYLKAKSGVIIDRLNPAILTNLKGMAQEYGKATGQVIPINDGFRTYEMQVAMKRKYGPRAAAPGKSLHEFGLAFDIDRSVAGKLEDMGLMRKYGFTRPVGGEPWHVEPAGIQYNVDGFKNDPHGAMDAIKSGLGRGGGGFGMQTNSPLGKRNPTLAQALFDEAVDTAKASEEPKPEAGPNANATIAQIEATPAFTGTPGVFTSDAPDPAAPSAPASAPAAAPAEGAPPVVAAAGMVPAADSMGPGESMDSEPAPAGASGTSVAQSVAQSTGGSPATQTVGGRARKASRAEIAHNSMSDPTAKVPQPQGSGYQAVKDTIIQAAKATGEDADTMIKVAAVESGFNPNARAKTSSATGLYQFINGTWQETVGKYGQRYGIDRNTPATDARANALMAGHYLGGIRKTLSPVLGRNPSAAEVYMGHFLGAGGARQFFSAMKANPSAPAAQAMPKAAKANRQIFYRNNQPLPFTEVFKGLEKKINTRAQQFGVPASSTPSMGEPAAEHSPSGSQNLGSEGGSPGGAPAGPVGTAAAGGVTAPSSESTKDFSSSKANGGDFSTGSSETGWDSAPAGTPIEQGTVVDTPRPLSELAKKPRQGRAPTATPPPSPMDGMFGFQHDRPPERVSRQTPEFNPKDLFNKTETILTDSLEVQRKIYSLLEGFVNQQQASGGKEEKADTPVEAQAQDAVSKRPRADALKVRSTPVSVSRSV